MSRFRWCLVACSLGCALGLGGQVTTAQYGNDRSNANVHETRLKPANVNAKQFGKLFRLAVDGDVYAEPLLLPHVLIAGKGEHDVLFVATEADSVYAFDAVRPGPALWRVTFTNGSRGVAAVAAESVGCPFISPTIGITSTPVIDARSGTLYVLVRTAERDASGTRRFWQRLHALDVHSGAERFGGPVTVGASLKGTGGGLFGLFTEVVEFGALRENPRAALTLANGKVYLTWASSCDVGPYYGWVMAYDAHSLKQVGVLNTAPEGKLSGIWQSDTGPAVDEAGNLYVATGNGVFDANRGGRDYGDSLLKIATGAGGGLSVASYFTPSEQEELNATDGDLGSGGPVLIPAQKGSARRLILTGGKGGKAYVIDRDRMGRYAAGKNPQAVQTIELGGGIMGAPAYWNGHVYYLASKDVLKEFAVEGGRLSAEPLARGNNEIVDPGATPSVSANGDKDGIVWVLETKGWQDSDRSAILYAYEAADVGKTLYHSEQDAGRDRAGVALRFVSPVVENGRVYVGTKGGVDVYGLLEGAIGQPLAHAQGSVSVGGSVRRWRVRLAGQGLLLPALGRRGE